MRPLRFIVKADDFTEFHFLPITEKASVENVVHCCDAAKSDKTCIKSCFNGAMFGQGHRDFLRALGDGMNDLRQIGEAPADENRKLLTANKPSLDKELLNCLCTIAHIGKDKSCMRDGVSIVDACKFYAQAFFAALVATHTIRKAEQKFYSLKHWKYDVYYDYINDEIIISKTPDGLFHRIIKTFTTQGYLCKDRKRKFNVTFKSLEEK